MFTLLSSQGSKRLCQYTSMYIQVYLLSISLAVRAQRCVCEREFGNCALSNSCGNKTFASACQRPCWLRNSGICRKNTRQVINVMESISLDHADNTQIKRCTHALLVDAVLFCAYYYCSTTHILCIIPLLICKGSVIMHEVQDIFHVHSDSLEKEQGNGIRISLESL